MYFFLTFSPPLFSSQVGGEPADQGPGCDSGDVHLGDHLLQRHRGLHRAVRRKHPAPGGGPTQRLVHVLRLHHRQLRRVQGESE